MHTPSSAARATGVTKSTIYRAIKAGRLCAHKLDSGNYAIYPAELYRAFPSAASFARQRMWRAPTLSASRFGMLAELRRLGTLKLPRATQR
jgi:excisionase family DNA binding protein